MLSYSFISRFFSIHTHHSYKLKSLVLYTVYSYVYSHIRAMLSYFSTYCYTLHTHYSYSISYYTITKEFRQDNRLERRNFVNFYILVYFGKIGIFFV